MRHLFKWFIIALTLAAGLASEAHADVVYFVFGFIPGPAYGFELGSAMVVPLLIGLPAGRWGSS